VDNGSTDGTARVAAQLGARVIRRPGGNIGAVRNTGVATARGDILVFLDADVLITPEWAARLPAAVDSLQQDHRVLTGSWCRVPADGSWLERWWFEPQTGDSHLGTGHMIMTRGFFDELRGFDEELATGEDYDLSRRAVASGGQIVIDHELRAEHLGWPRTLGAFIRREAWHGVGDFSSISAFIRSKVALATAMFALFHLLIIGGVLTYNPWLAGTAAAAVVGLCLASSAVKFRGQPLRTVLLNAAVYWVYYLGRTLSLIPWLSSYSRGGR
jgi:glycosyltransferase involved in cell wall biosynthesis